ncbi:MAG TPA: DUF1501 domain-containing protein [Verrucomicrobiales bacterium]|nr:DUF1501 domain-containing protein [Verrucomicrobiales bacterium]
MNMNWLPSKLPDPQKVSRRWFLKDCGIGLGTIALGSLFSQSGYGAGLPSDVQNLNSSPSPHYRPKAKKVIFLFMAGAPSHLEMFDYKPELAKYDGTRPPEELVKGYRAAFIDPNATFLGPKFKFAKHGRCGAEISELLPHLSEVVDDIAIVKSLSTDAFNHAPAQIMMNTGSPQFGRPSMGSWLLYGLGSEARDLPGFVVMNSGKKGPSGGNSNWGSGFLPTHYQGVQFRGSGEPVLYLTNPQGVDPVLQRDSLNSLNRLNQLHHNSVGDPEIITRIRSYEMAFRMQTGAPELMDLSREPRHILESYGAEPGKPSFANNCLLARRMIERGVRFVELFHESWDQHGNLKKDLAKNCHDTDRASAALVKDLKQRGLLEDTLVIWGGEFGRTPMVQGGGNDGRDHHPNAFSMWLAGGGIKPGLTLGQTDEFGFNATEDPVHVHDLHATILHLLGFNHKQLTYRFQGRDFRLTDVHGNVVHKLLA